MPKKKPSGKAKDNAPSGTVDPSNHGKEHTSAEAVAHKAFPKGKEPKG